MADISKIQVGTTTYDVTDKAEHADLDTTAKTYVGGINELDSTKQKKIYSVEPANPVDGDIWFDPDDNSGDVQDQDAGDIEYEQGASYPNNSVGAALNSQSSQISNFQSYLDAFKRYNFFINKGKVHGGYDLGSTFTAAQQEAIANGSFSEMDIGDYWSFGGKRQRIWDGDWALNKGDIVITEHHLVLMTDDNMLKADGSTTHYMNDTNTTEGGYAGTKYRSAYRSQLKNTWAGWFGSVHILTHRELLCNAVTDGKASGWAWSDCDVELPSEVMMYGSPIWSNYTDGGSGYNVGAAYPQLALAAIDPSRVINRENYWLRDVASAWWFAGVNHGGDANYNGASNVWFGLRPYILLK